MTEPLQDRWLSLGQASAMLNVHPSTLRRWADGGLVPCQRTPGGHRRFGRQALLPLLDGGMPSPERAEEGAAVQLEWSDRWGENGQPEPLRETWQRLGGVVASYLVHGDADERLSDDALRLGMEIARLTVAGGGGLLHAASDYLQFRSSLLPIAVGQPGGESVGPAGDVPRFDRVVGQALLGIAEGFSASEAPLA